MLDARQVQAILPQRYPLIMVDRVLSYEPGRSRVGLKNVSSGDVVMPGHFPGNPVFPGAAMLEGMAQCAILLFALTRGPLREGEVPLFGSVSARFLDRVVPGDAMRFEIEVVKMTSFGGVFKGRVTVSGAVVAHCELSMARQKSDGRVF